MAGSDRYDDMKKKTSVLDQIINNDNVMVGNPLATIISLLKAEDVKTNIMPEQTETNILEYIYVLRFSKDKNAKKIMSFVAPKVNAYPNNKYFSKGNDSNNEKIMNQYEQMGIDKNVQMYIYNKNNLDENKLKNYKKSPYNFKERDAKMFHPFALLGELETTNTIYRRKAGEQYQIDNNENLEKWWDNLQASVLAFYMMKYGMLYNEDGTMNKTDKDVNQRLKKIFETDFKEQNAAYKDALGRSARYMWGEWEPCQGFHRGIDFTLTDTITESVAKGQKTAYVHSIGNGAVQRITPYSICIQDDATNMYITYVHLSVDSQLKEKAIVAAGQRLGTENIKGYGGETSYLHTHLEFCKYNVFVTIYGYAIIPDFVFEEKTNEDDKQREKRKKEEENEHYPKMFAARNTLPMYFGKDNTEKYNTLEVLYNGSNYNYLSSSPYASIRDIWKYRMRSIDSNYNESPSLALKSLAEEKKDEKKK